MMHLSRRHVVALLGLSLLGCRKDSGPEPPDRGKILSDLTTNIVRPAYDDAVTDVRALEARAIALRDAPTAESLAAARAAWRKARATWKFTDAFLFGPADDLAITAGAIDTAGDAVKLEKRISDGSTIDAATIAKLGANERGFGAVEVLLFDPARDDVVMLGAFGDAGSRRGTLATVVAADLTAKVTAVRDAWSPAGFGDQLAKAGRGSTIYTAEHQGIDAVVNALVSAAEIIIALRLAKPLGLDVTPNVARPELIESPRADASLDDILAALAGIEAVYFGRRGAAQGLPLADAVADRNPSADARLRDALVQAKAAVTAVPGPLRTAVVDRRDPVIAAHVACREVKRALAIDVAGALGTSVGFAVTDGD
ncbi:MAG: imelysin family protein [Labilithrix sp.]|nr:imelysin family protein [Labilithrix sp.]MCW5815539.1 imelysin family protein [Labilithrix sp.]